MLVGSILSSNAENTSNFEGCLGGYSKRHLGWKSGTCMSSSLCNILPVTRDFTLFLLYSFEIFVVGVGLAVCLHITWMPFNTAGKLLLIEVAWSLPQPLTLKRQTCWKTKIKARPLFSVLFLLGTSRKRGHSGSRGPWHSHPLESSVPFLLCVCRTCVLNKNVYHLVYSRK